MADPVTTLTAAAIADLAFRKFIESGAGELAKKYTGDAIAKMDELRKKIWDKMRGKPTAETALTSLEQGSKAELDRLIAYLQVAMDDDPQFADEIQVMAQQIQAGKIQDNSSMVMSISDHGTGYQTRNEVTNQGGENYTGNITINKHYSTDP
jgi:hypothetical protein